ncbi:hypothetical protein HDU93_005441 [Gonapodya sp. JEL0774]|nr:hypothetical protein HDU93_005441 [Gonapodya sp. JEL0774]
MTPGTISPNPNEDHSTKLDTARSRFVIPFPYWLTPRYLPGRATKTEIRGKDSEGGWFWEEAGYSDAIRTPGVGGVAEDIDFQRRNYFARETSFACHNHSLVLALRRSDVNASTLGRSIAPAAGDYGSYEAVHVDVEIEPPPKDETSDNTLEAGKIDVESKALNTSLPLKWTDNETVHEVAVNIDAAFIVLYEFPGAVALEAPDILHHGFLIVDVAFPKQVKLVHPTNGSNDVDLTLADVLKVGEACAEIKEH